MAVFWRAKRLNAVSSEEALKAFLKYRAAVASVFCKADVHCKNPHIDECSGICDNVTDTFAKQNYYPKNREI